MEVDADTDSFGEVELLQGLSARRRQQLIEQANPVHYRAGEWLFREGDSANCAYIVRSGRIEIVSEGTQRQVLRCPMPSRRSLTRAPPVAPLRSARAA